MLLATRAGRVAARMPVARAAAAQRFYADDVADKISLTFAAPHISFYADAPVSKIDVPGLTGDMGVLPSHVPIVAVLKPGVVSVFESESDAAVKYFVSSGSCTVNEDSSVQIIAEEAVALDDLDLAAARAGLDAFTAKLNSADDAAKAEAEIGVEVHQAMIKALE